MPNHYSNEVDGQLKFYQDYLPIVDKSLVKTTRENGWLALRLKASATGRGLKAYRMVSLQHHLC
ncbi:hypothetical protein CQA85_04650 [Streptococcus salivarius]|nr:hypothetical protein CQA85_04650 [Streptococcus salivarius]